MTAREIKRLTAIATPWANGSHLITPSDLRGKSSCKGRVGPNKGDMWRAKGNVVEVTDIEDEER